MGKLSKVVQGKPQTELIPYERNFWKYFLLVYNIFLIKNSQVFTIPLFSSTKKLLLLSLFHVQSFSIVHPINFILSFHFYHTFHLVILPVGIHIAHSLLLNFE